MMILSMSSFNMIKCDLILVTPVSGVHTVDETVSSRQIYFTILHCLITEKIKYILVICAVIIVNITGM